METFQIIQWLSTEPDIKDALSGDHAKSKTSLWCILHMENHSEGFLSSCLKFPPDINFRQARHEAQLPYQFNPLQHAFSFATHDKMPHEKPERKFRTLTLMLGKLSSLSDCQHYQLASISKSHHLHIWRGRRWGKAIGPLNLHHPLQIRQSSHPASHRSSFSE